MEAPPTRSVQAIRGERGSVLITALIAATALSLLAASFIQLIVGESRMTQRSLEYNSLLAIAEAGVEDALWSINNNDWTGWKAINGGADRYKQLTDVPMDGKRSNAYQVIVQDAESTPTIYSEAVTDFFNGNEIKRQIRVEYEVGNAAGTGLVAKDTITINGSPVIDSYNSSLGAYNFITNRGDQVMVGSTSTAKDALRLSGQVLIWGYAGTSNKNPWISGPNNRILGNDSPTGINVDWERVTNDFTFNFPDVAEPDWSGASNSAPVNAGVVNDWGSSGSLTKYTLNELKIASDTVIRVVGDVQLLVDKGMSITGNAMIVVEPGASLEVYSPDDISIAGNGLVNKTNIPGNMEIYGTATNPGGQKLYTGGGAAMEAVFYAPNAIATIAGTGDFSGSIVAHQIEHKGQANFHYDETLGGTAVDVGAIGGWHELRGSDQQLAFDTYVTNHP